MKILQAHLNAIKSHYTLSGWEQQDFNLFNIRNLNNLRKDVFNDLSGFFTENEIHVFQSTTDPGKKCIQDGGPGRGALFLKEGFHKKTLCIDIHNKRVGQAFCHRPKLRYLDGQFAGCNLQGIYRDYDRDFNIKNNPKVLYDGRGANVHPAHKYKILRKIGNYSAGCRVYLIWKEFQFALSEAKKTDMYLKNPAVTLFSESMFNLDQDIDFINDIYQEFYGV